MLMLNTLLRNLRHVVWFTFLSILLCDLIQEKAVAQQVTKTTIITAITTRLSWNIKFTPEKLQMKMDTNEHVLLQIIDNDTDTSKYNYELRSKNRKVAFVEYTIPGSSIDPITNVWIGNITVSSPLIGATQIYVERIDTLSDQIEQSKEYLDVIVVRRMRVIDHVFTGSVALLVSLLYINFGAALDLQALRSLVGRPVGPAIGFITQFLFMPLLSYGLGLLLFPESAEMQLGLFFTGVSCSGGASNIWTVLLGGNINLSILMTAIGNIAAFGTMPFWLFTLGSLIFARFNIEVPYKNIATFAISLIVPLTIGLAIQKCSPRITRVLVRLLKPISTCLILFIIVFAIVTNLYIFELFSWQIVLAGLLLPLLGYFLAWIVAKSLRQNSADALTIAIETGVQNTGISIFLLRFSLEQPYADLTTVIPVAVAIMTPIPLLGLYIYRRCTGRIIKDGITEESYIVNHHQEHQQIVANSNHSNIS